MEHAEAFASGSQLKSTIIIDRSRNTITYHNALCGHSKILHKHCLKFLLGVKMAPRETENNAYAKFWGDKQRALWYVMVFSGAVNSLRLSRSKKKTQKQVLLMWTQ